MCGASGRVSAKTIENAGPELRLERVLNTRAGEVYVSRIFNFIETIVNAVYGTPDPQVQTYFRDLRVTPSESPADDDDDTHYRFVPEPNGSATHSLTVGSLSPSAQKLSPRRPGRQEVAAAGK